MEVTPALYNAPSVCEGSWLMFSQDDEGQQGWVLAVVLGLTGAVVALVLAVAIVQARGASGLAPAAASPAPAASPASAPVALVVPTPVSVLAEVPATAVRDDAGSVKVERDLVKFYFASGQSDLAEGAADALVGLVRASGRGSQFVVSGFHDASGDPVRNAELARRRALSVRDALVRLGVPQQQIELRKPESVASAATDPESRRVEITLR